MDPEVTGKALSQLGKSMAPGLIAHAREMGVKLPAQLDDPDAELTPELIIEVLRDVAWFYFPGLAPLASGTTGQ